MYYSQKKGHNKYNVLKLENWVTVTNLPQLEYMPVLENWVITIKMAQAHLRNASQLGKQDRKICHNEKKFTKLTLVKWATGKFKKNKKMCHSQKNGSQLEKCVTARKMCHTLKMCCSKKIELHLGTRVIKLYNSYKTVQQLQNRIAVR